MKSSGVRLVDVLRLRWRSLWGRPAVEEELDEELRFHFDSAVERYVREGMTREAALRRARIEAGLPEQLKEECRDARGVTVIENVGRDIVYAFRNFRKSPGFALIAVLTVALGIGVNTGMFTFVYALLMRPLPVHDPGSLYNVYADSRGEGNRSGYGSRYYVSFPEFTHIRDHAKTAELAAVAAVTMSRQGDSREVRAQLVSHNLLGLLGARPVLGRFFLPEETARPGSEPVVVLSHAAWQNWFGGSADVVGRGVVLNRTPFTIVGVAEQGVHGPLIERADIWIPYTMQPVTRPGEPFIDRPEAGWLQVFARPRADMDAVRAEMAVLVKQAFQPHLPKRTVTSFVERASLANTPDIGRKAGTIIAMLFAAVGLVLLVACANVANMLLARGLARRREIAIRLSIGAGRRRLLQQLLTESVLLAVAGGVLGVGLSMLMGQAVFALAPLSEVGQLQVDVRPDGAVLLFTLVVSVLTGLIFGLLPSVQTLRLDLTPSLRSEGIDAARSRFRLKGALIALQAGVCLVLLANAGLLLRGFQSALTINAGVSSRNVLIANFDLRQQQYDAAQATQFMNTLRENVSMLPQVLSASTAFVDPLQDQCGTMIREVAADGTAGPERLVSCDEVGPDYFRTMQVPLVTGREFSRGEAVGNHPVAIIDERYARTVFGGAHPIGRRLRWMSQDLEIVGVAADIHPLNPTAQARPRVYTPMRGLRNTEAKLVVRYSGAAVDVEKSVRAAVSALDGNVNMRMRGIGESLGEALAPARAAAAMASALGVFALILACTGIYGVIAFAVSQRRREVGIRVALGARAADVLRLVVWQGLKPVLVGGVLGLGAAAAAAQLLQSLLYGVSPLDPVAFGLTALLLMAVALVAAFVPARGALGVDPAITLRHD